jgi:hypothetical protein
MVTVKWSLEEPICFANSRPSHWAVSFGTYVVQDESFYIPIINAEPRHDKIVGKKTDSGSNGRINRSFPWCIDTVLISNVKIVMAWCALALLLGTNARFVSLQFLSQSIEISMGNSLLLKTLIISKLTTKIWGPSLSHPESDTLATLPGPKFSMINLGS